MSRSPKPFTAADDAAICRLYAENVSQYEIARAVGNTDERVRDRIRELARDGRLKLVRRRVLAGARSQKPWTPELDADLVKLYNAGASERTIATALDRSMGSVQSRTQRLREQGVLQARPRTKAVLKTGPSLSNVRYKEATGVGPWGGKKLENVELKFSPTWSYGCAVEWAHRWGLELEEVRPRA